MALLLIFILLIICNSYFVAKYISSINGESNRSIAKWNVECNSTSPDTLSLVSGNHQESYTLNVTSISEVSANYSVKLSNVPNNLEVKIDNENFQTSDNNNVIEFNSIGSFTPNDINNTYSHTITFNAPLDMDIPSINNINIDVIFNQVD